jgi:hypothetical protein
MPGPSTSSGELSIRCEGSWSHRPDLNRGPTVYEDFDRSTRLHQLSGFARTRRKLSTRDRTQNHSAWPRGGHAERDPCKCGKQLGVGGMEVPASLEQDKHGVRTTIPSCILFACSPTSLETTAGGSARGASRTRTASHSLWKWVPSSQNCALSFPRRSAARWSKQVTAGT